ncbi:hypothetical protein N7517_002237 [Penicillium concentricum]|uniref:F-box domain-containing protein n=1 Tax=Penicillium concentricum TaxID=293559 RepID=A0A9W9VLE0_9EURO|nr:uncharacterized protein N7517_002237 [Penicillium concentricum]KAJ5384326.1 hypothetical protein N7517_002237 [Penicillium concentricum]
MGLNNFPEEVIEIILILVNDEQTLLLAQRVCRRWARCIQDSQALQQALFYQPIKSTLPRTTTPRRNPLLAAKFPYWFPNDNQIPRDILFGAGDMQEFLDKHAAWLHPSASWRRMLVQQPPAMSMGWVDRQESSIHNITLRRWELSLEEYGGLRMNMIYDLVVKSSDQAAKFFYWRMYWSHPGLKKSHIRCNPDMQSDRPDEYLEAMMSANAQTDIVLETWNTNDLRPHLWSTFAKDTWTWDLIRGLQSPMEDVNLDVVYALRKHKELRRWQINVQSWDLVEMYRDGYGYPLLDDIDPDL